MKGALTSVSLLGRLPADVSIRYGALIAYYNDSVFTRTRKTIDFDVVDGRILMVYPSNNVIVCAALLQYARLLNKSLEHIARVVVFFVPN